MAKPDILSAAVTKAARAADATQEANGTVGVRQAVAKLVQIRLSCSGLCRSACCADPEGEVGLRSFGVR